MDENNRELDNRNGADFDCENEVGQYVVLYTESRWMALKNVAVYAGYDCHLADWSFPLTGKHGVPDNFLLNQNYYEKNSALEFKFYPKVMSSLLLQ